MLTVLLSIHAVAMTTDEVENHQREQRQQAESAIETRTAVPVEEPLQPRSRHSGRGLSRLFSSLLKRRSQCESDAGDKQDEEETKAPIADPEPELRAEGEAAQDQHSVSSAEAQVSLMWRGNETRRTPRTCRHASAQFSRVHSSTMWSSCCCSAAAA